MAHFAMLVAGVTACVFAALMLFSRSLYVSAVCQLVVLFQAAVFFFFAGAPMLAFLQVMIYAGAVMVLIVIMIMAAPALETGGETPLSLPKPFAAAVIVVPLVETAVILWRGALPEGSVGGALAVQSQLGPVLFGPYAVATEVVTVLMFLAGLAIVERRAR
ncbi:MAG: NADH-quinone oxidoreductase subunit J [Elusimicrobia bacterium]|nr:NADH-quinone oxidoreductase subunit J [Elusimicrobiota bacterium]